MIMQDVPIILDWTLSFASKNFSFFQFKMRLFKAY